MTSSGPPLSPLTKVPLTPKKSYRVTPPNENTIRIAHITDTHLGLRERVVYEQIGAEGSKPVKVRVPSFEKFRRLLKTLQALNPDVIIHTGDIADRELWYDRQRYEEFKSTLPDLSGPKLLLFIRGNHDDSLTRGDLCELFDGLDTLSIEDDGPIPLVDGQIIVDGRDYQEEVSADSFLTDLTTQSDNTIRIGAFHQSFRQVSRSFDANVDLADLAPPHEPIHTYYDLLLFGHMHKESVQQIGDCLLVSGGPPLGVDVQSSVGLFTFSTATSHYQRFPFLR